MTATESEQERRKYWIEYMDGIDAMFDEMMAYPCEECGEELASITDAMAAAGVEVLFSDTKIAGELDRIYFIRESIVPALVRIAREMNDRGWILKIEEGFRTREMQTRLGSAGGAFDLVVERCVWECEGRRPPVDLVFRRARSLIANYPKTGTHMHAAAVDISVLGRDDGSELWRGGPYLEMSEKTPMSSPFVSEEEHANRMAITEVMEKHGFMHYPGEFWHYNQGDVLDQILRKTGEPGRFGAVHWDSSTNRVTPLEDPLEPLIPLEQMAREIDRALAAAGTLS